MSVQGDSLTIGSATRSALQRWRVPLGFLAAALFVICSRPTWRSLTIGAPVALGGLAIRAWASGHLRKNAELATGGPYAYTRNPLYFGSFIMLLGCALGGGNWWLGLLLIGLFFAVYGTVMQLEAAHLRRLFADAYARWAAEVPLFVPRLTPYGAGPQRGFDYRLYLRHREYRALLGLATVMAVLALKATGILGFGF
jgi:protein-S-isoprenylcysteine O-methyltransferase Ste14